MVRAHLRVRPLASLAEESGAVRAILGGFLLVTQSADNRIGIEFLFGVAGQRENIRGEEVGLKTRGSPRSHGSHGGIPFSCRGSIFGNFCLLELEGRSAQRASEGSFLLLKRESVRGRIKKDG